MFRFEQLEIYKKSVDCVNKVYAITSNWRALRHYALADQLRRAAISISLNVAEGSSRSKKDFRRFLDISRGSCYECVALTQIALAQDLITQIEFDNLYQELEELSKMLSGLKRSLQ